MRRALSRREFVKAGTAASVAAAVPAAAFGQAPDGARPQGDAARRDLLRQRPRVPERRPAHLRRGGLAADRRRARTCSTSLIAGVNIVELDPDRDVRRLRRPAERRRRRAARLLLHARAAEARRRRRRARGRAHAVARREGGARLHRPPPAGRARARRRSRAQMGFTIEADLNTEASRAKWLEWKRRVDPGHYLDPKKRVGGGRGRVAAAWCADGLLDPHRRYGTINCDGVGPKGEVCGVTTTSGLAFKIPGRVGDSPILGAGLWVDDAVGRGGLDRPRRGQPLQPLVVLHRRGDAAGPLAEGRGAWRRCGASRPAPSRSGCSTRDGQPELPAHLLRRQQEGRVRRRLDVRARRTASPSASPSAPRRGRSSLACEPLRGRRPPMSGARRRTVARAAAPPRRAAAVHRRASS